MMPFPFLQLPPGFHENDFHDAVRSTCKARDTCLRFLPTCARVRVCVYLRVRVCVGVWVDVCVFACVCMCVWVRKCGVCA